MNATRLALWHFLTKSHRYYVSGVEAWVPANNSAFIILGDSITDGRGSDNDKNNRSENIVKQGIDPQSLT
jgi:hypothetical protein